MYFCCTINNIHMSENCMKCIMFYSMYQPFILCPAIHLANWMDFYCPRWPPPADLLVAEGAN